MWYTTQVTLVQNKEYFMKNRIASSLAAAGTATAAFLGSAPQVMAQGLRDVQVETPRGFALSFGDLLNGVLSFVLIIGALLVLFYLILGGIEWITSGGDKGKTEGARNKITAAVIGLIVLAAAWAILTVVLNFLGFRNLNEVFDNAGTINGGSQTN